MITSSDGRVAGALAAARAGGRAALVPYCTAGHPDRDATLAFLRGLDGLADLVELGIPFSDPVADGPTIQRASHEALRAGMSVSGTLALLAEAAPAVPVVLFSYLNPVLRHGVEAFASEARAAGASALLLTDLPTGTDPALEDRIRGAGLDLVPLVAPTTPPARIAAIAATAPPFLYLVARLGVTGARAQLDDTLAPALARVREHAAVPVCVGFGVSTPDQVRVVSAMADGVVVGSALVERLGAGGAAAGHDFLRLLRPATRREGQPSHA